MGKKEPGWKAYTAIVQTSIPRLQADSEELQNRCKLMSVRDWAQAERSKSGWQEDQLLVTMIAWIGPYALDSRCRPDQIAGLWDAVHKLWTMVGHMRAVDLP